MKAAADYFSQDYAADFDLHGHDSLCGFNLVDMMRQPKRSQFRGFAEFALCQFALNLHNQAIYSHFASVHPAWRAYVAPFGNTLLCFSGHGLGSHAPDSILRFVQAPLDRKLPPVRYEWADVSDYIHYFFGEYLSPFVATVPDSGFTPEQYVSTITTDHDCRASVLTDSGWQSRHVTGFLRSAASA